MAEERGLGWGKRIKAPKASRSNAKGSKGSAEYGAGFPTPTNYGTRMSIVISTSGVRGGARQETDLSAF